MEITQQQERPAASTLAYIAALLFAIRFIFFFLPYLPFIPRGFANLFQDGTISGALLGNAEHLVLFPVVAALPAPNWARGAGYGWLVVDMATDILALQGVPAAIFLPLRYGGHISSALWVGVASWQAKRAIAVIGLLYALDLLLYSYTPHGTFFILLPSALLLPLWLILVGRYLSKNFLYQNEK